MTCPYCPALRRRLLLAALAILPARAFGRAPPGSDPSTPRAQWFANQKNMMGGSCCQLGDGHELDPGDVRYDEETGLWSVRLPDPSVKTFGHSLNEQSGKPKQWVTIPALKMRNPDGGMPPLANPIIWYDTYDAGGGSSYSIYCFDANPQL